MAVFRSAGFVGEQNDISRVLGELARLHGLKITCSLEPSSIAHHTLLEEQHLFIKLEDVGDPELIASPKVRIKAFLAALASGVQRLCTDRGIRVSVFPRDGALRRQAIEAYYQEAPLAGADMWAEYERSFDLQGQNRGSFLLRFVAADGLFNTTIKQKTRTSTFI